MSQSLRPQGTVADLRAAVLIAAGLALARLVVLFVTPLELYPDEAEFHACLGWATWLSLAPSDGAAAQARPLIERALQLNPRLDRAYVADLQIGVNAQASGTMLVGKDDRAATALHLYTEGHVPPVIPLPPFRRDVPPRTATRR